MRDRIKEADTMIPRTIHVTLSDEDVQRLTEKAGEVGLSVSRLLENFIGDLVDGTYSNGSDERMYANQWFNRCWFSRPFEQEDSFLRFSLLCGDVFEVLSCWDGIQEAREDLENVEKARSAGYVRPARYEEAVTDLRNSLKFEEEELQDMYTGFLETCKDREAVDFDTQMQEILAWREEKFILEEGGV